MRKFFLARLAVICAAAAAAGCGGGEKAGSETGDGGGGADGSGPVRVAVSIPPLEGLVRPLAEAVGGEVSVLVPVGVSEHGFEMTPRAVKALAGADVVVVVGLGLDANVEEVARRGGRARVVELAAVVGEAAAEEEHEHDEADHGADLEPADADHDHAGHSHGSRDPHLWLNPAYARELVLAAKEAVEEAARQREGWSDEADSRLEAAAADLVGRIDKLDAAYRAALDAAPVKVIVVAHDAWRRLAERYGVETVAIAGLAGGEPRPEAIRQAVEAIEEHGLGAVYREPQMSDAACRRVAEAVGRETGREVKVLVLDPLGRGDWVAMMERNLAALKEGLGIGSGDSETGAESEG
jgi:zinc transport system substrate-binding protein